MHCTCTNLRPSYLLTSSVPQATAKLHIGAERGCRVAQPTFSSSSPSLSFCLVSCSWKMGPLPRGATCLPCASRPSPSASCSAPWSSASSFPTVRPVCAFFHTCVAGWLWVSEVCVFLSVGGEAGKLYDVFECDFTSQWLSQSNTLPKSEP